MPMTTNPIITLRINGIFDFTVRTELTGSQRLFANWTHPPPELRLYHHTKRVVTIAFSAHAFLTNPLVGPSFVHRPTTNTLSLYVSVYSFLIFPAGGVQGFAGSDKF